MNSEWNQWYNSSFGGAYDYIYISYKGTGDDIYNQGFWNYGGKNITYYFELNEDTYYVI